MTTQNYDYIPIMIVSPYDGDSYVCSGELNEDRSTFITRWALAYIGDKYLDDESLPWWDEGTETLGDRWTDPNDLLDWIRNFFDGTYFIEDTIVIKKRTLDTKEGIKSLSALI